MIITSYQSPVYDIFLDGAVGTVLLLCKDNKEEKSDWNIVGLTGQRLGYGALYVWNAKQNNFEAINEDDSITDIALAAGGDARYSLDLSYGVRENGIRKSLWFSVDSKSDEVDNLIDWIDTYKKNDSPTCPCMNGTLMVRANPPLAI